MGYEFRVNSITLNNQRYPVINGLTNGGYIIAWQASDSTIHAQYFTADNNRDGN